MTRIVTFGELVSTATLEIGDGYRAKNQELGGNGLIFLRAAYLQDAGFTMDQPDRFLTNAFVNFGPKIAQIGDVVITTKGNSTGRVGRIREPQAGSVYSPHLSYWRSKRRNELDQSFLFYWSQSPEFRSQLAGMASSTDMAPYLSLRDQLRLRISLPQIEDQSAIASILAALDDKIDVNRRMNETLEAMARAIFKDWFVDFGPTRAKMEGRSPYLAPEIWSLFPDRLDQDGKPEGWHFSRLGDFFRLERGLSYKGDFLTDTGTPMVNLGCFQGGGRFDAQKIKPYSGDFRPRHKVQPGDMVLANTDMTQKRVVLGSPHVLSSDDGDELIFSHHVYAARSLNLGARRWTRFFYFHLLQPEFRERAEGFATGTTVLFLPSDAAENLTFVLPTEKINEVFLAAVEPIFQACDTNDRVNKTLGATRDLLLPKLLSSEIRLRDAEKTLEAVA